MKKFILLTSFLCSSVLTFAQLVTWNGGRGDWDVASNWSSGSVPTLTNDVEILSGQVRIDNGVNAEALSLFIDYNSSMLVETTGTLLISGATGNSGLENDGVMNVRGELNIENVLAGVGIWLDGTLTVESGGTTKVHNTSSEGIRITGTGTLVNKGNLVVDLSGSDGIFSSNDLLNDVNGNMTITNCTSEAIGMNTTFARFHNGGSFHTENVTNGIYVSSGTVDNLETGTIDIDNPTSNGILITSGQMINRGVIDVDASPSHSGIDLRDGFLNESTGQVFIDNGSFGFDANGTAVTLNRGLIHAGPNNINGGLTNSGILTNEVCGNIILDSRLHNNAGGTFNNDGWVENNHTGTHRLIGTLINNGVIEDNPLNISGLITHNGVLVEPLTGPVQVGVATPNALNLVNWGNYVSLGWYREATLITSAGVYDPVANTFVADAAVQGVTELYIHFQELTTFCEIVMRVDIPGGVLPYAPPAPTFRPTNTNGHNTAISAERFSVYPNPASSVFNIKNANGKGEHRVEVFNAVGKEVMEVDMDFSQSRSHEIDASGSLTNGLYYLVISKAGKMVQTEKLNVIK
ncbi:MAG: T9SS type A sorting domain-containing protein [Bacteroidota bacterium]